MKNENGFTLVELMITLAIVAILLTIGVPSFQTFILDNRLVTQANRIATDINMARSAAIKYQRSGKICVSSNSTTAAPSCTGGTDWSQGWIVWVDKNRDGSPDVPGEIVVAAEALSGTTTLTSTALSTISYDSRGFATITDTLTLCDDRTGEVGRNIDIRGAGRINISKNTTSC